MEINIAIHPIDVRYWTHNFSGSVAMDLNLLAALDVLIEEANVTRAATRLGVSQPALSAQLVKLRGMLGDPLLIPSNTGRGMVPTARALALRDPLRAALKDLHAAVRPSQAFDPLQAERTFTIAASDLATFTLGLPLIERMRDNAGSEIRLDFRNLPMGTSAGSVLERGDVDMVIGVGRHLAPELKARKIFDDRYVLIQRKKHPQGRRALDLATYCRLGHVLVSPVDGGLHGAIDEILEASGHHRNVVLSVQQFLLAPMIVERTDWVAALPERFAKRFSNRVDVVDLPFETPRFDMYVAWHPRSHTDAAHVWLRSLLTDLAKEPPA